MSRYAHAPARTADEIVGAADLPQAIAQSWRRSELCGVDRAARLEELDEHYVDPESALIRAADPVLSSMMSDLAGAGVAVLLAGHDGVVLDVRPPALRGPVADLAAARTGRRCTEEEVGTNSIGTVLELSRPIRISGDEHYVQSLRQFDCLGAPVVNPVTGRIQGVLSLCAARSTLHPAFAPFLSQSVRAITDQLQTGAPRAHLELLQAFRAVRGHASAIAVLGPDLVLTSRKAAAMLDPLDHVRLRELGADAGPDGMVLEQVELASGREVALTFRSCGSRGSGILVEIRDPRTAGRVPIPRGANARPSGSQGVVPLLSRVRARRERLLITGEAGTGRSWALAELAGPAETIVLDCAESATGACDWEQRLTDALTAATAPPAPGAQPVLLVLESIDLLSTRRASQALVLISRSDAWLAMTAPPAETLAGEHAALAACCGARLHLSPVRARIAELPLLIEDITRSYCQRAGRSAPRWTSEAVAVLAAHPWPGNLHELRAVVERAVSDSPGSRVIADVLPAGVVAPPRRALSPLQQADRQVIEAALRACGGNKVHAASQLGISRTTLYKRMRELDLDAGVTP